MRVILYVTTKKKKKKKKVWNMIRLRVSKSSFVIKILSLVTVNYAWEFRQNVQIGKSKYEIGIRKFSLLKLNSISQLRFGK